MGVPEKLAGQATSILGVAVHAASMVVPPGATLYKAFSPAANLRGVSGGPIGDALTSRIDDSSVGTAATMPRQMGVLAVTDELVFCKKRLIGVGCRQRVTSWPLDDVSATFESADRWKYPAVLLTFGDGSSCTIYGEKRWGLDALANAVNRMSS